MSYNIKPEPSIDWQARAKAAEEHVQDAITAIEKGKHEFRVRLSDKVYEERRLKAVLIELFDAVKSHLTP